MSAAPTCDSDPTPTPADPAATSASAAAAAAGSASSDSPAPDQPQPQSPEAFFAGLRLDRSQLAALASFGRGKCPRCATSKKHFCYECALLVGVTPGIDCPRLHLPIRVR